MDMTTLLVILAIGAVSGWLAGFIRQGYGFGLLGNIIIGIIGSFVGGWLFGQLGVSIGSGLVGVIAKSVIVALAILTGLRTVNQGTVAVTTIFGKYQRTLPPGLNFRTL